MIWEEEKVDSPLSRHQSLCDSFKAGATTRLHSGCSQPVISADGQEGMVPGDMAKECQIKEQDIRLSESG